MLRRALVIAVTLFVIPFVAAAISIRFNNWLIQEIRYLLSPEPRFRKTHRIWLYRLLQKSPQPLSTLPPCINWRVMIDKGVIECETQGDETLISISGYGRQIMS